MSAMTQAVACDSAVSRPSNTKRQISLQDSLLLTSFLIFFVLEIALAFRLNINWDEYFYLSHIYSARDGRSLESLQTFHVHLLGWLTLLPLDEADQVVTGRLFMLLCQSVSLACLYRIAREFSGWRDAALATFAYLASGFVLAHGISFRADPLAGMLMMAMVALLFCGPLKWWVAAAAGILAALAFLVTIKIAFFAPGIGAAFLWRWSKSASARALLVHFAQSGVVAAAVGTALFFLHTESLVVASTSVPGTNSMVTSAANSAGLALDKVILSQGLFPRASEIQRWLLSSLLPLIIVGLGISSALGSVRENQLLRGTALLCLLLPLATLAFYRNAFAYFFPFIFLLPAILGAVGASRLTGSAPRNALVAGMLLVLLGQQTLLWQRDQSAQRSVARAVHTIFPEPVAYIDRNGMIPSFPKANQFISTWGLEVLLASGVPVVRPIIEGRHPPLLIANSPVLEAALEPSATHPGHLLHPVDEKVLRSNYIPHWGPIWVAGKAFREPSGRFTLSIPGVYTLECIGSRSIDRRLRKCGETMVLTEGVHQWAQGMLVLRWGEHLPRPSGAPPERPIYYGF